MSLEQRSGGRRTPSTNGLYRERRTRTAQRRRVSGGRVSERSTRRYTLKRRAERQEETRSRIVEAAIAAHQTGDPDETSISAIARRARVSRLTIYRHFPDELSLYTACTTVYHARNPLPDLSGLAEVEDPMARLSAALTGLYAYYSDNEAMLRGAVTESASHPAMLTALKPWFDALEALRELLASGWPGRAEPGSIAAGALGHALAVQTWISLRTIQGLTNAQAVTLMTSLVTAAIDATPRPGTIRGR
jgi:AcrR family transcriptional regulator